MNDFKYGNLKWALSTNKKFLKIKIFNKYASGSDYLDYADELINYLRKNNCTNIQSKFSGGGKLTDFYASIAELNIGKYLIENGFSVYFIPDKQIQKSVPDIYAIKNNIKCLIEVKRIIEDEYIRDVMDYLQHSIKVQNPLTIIWLIPSELSKLALSRGDKNYKQEKLGIGITQLENELQLIEDYSSPIEISTKIGLFNVKKGGLEDSNFVSVRPKSDKDDSFCDKIKKDVLKKLRKHKCLMNIHKNNIYIISLVLEEQYPILPNFCEHLKIALTDPTKGLFNTSQETNILSLVIGNYNEKHSLFFNKNRSDYKKISKLFNK